MKRPLGHRSHDPSEWDSQDPFWKSSQQSLRYILSNICLPTQHHQKKKKKTFYHCWYRRNGYQKFILDHQQQEIYMCFCSWRQFFDEILHFVFCDWVCCCCCCSSNFFLKSLAPTCSSYQEIPSQEHHQSVFYFNKLRKLDDDFKERERERNDWTDVSYVLISSGDTQVTSVLIFSQSVLEMMIW